MTQKYLWVRREVYEKGMVSKIKSYRSFSDMVKLFRCSYWIMLGMLAISLIGILLIIVFAPTSLLFYPLMIIIITVSLLSEIPREKYLYKDSARQEELAEAQAKYQSYIIEIWDLLKKYNINTPDMVSQLKLECKSALKAHEDRYHKINNRIFDMLIGVPLGALIASVIYAENNVAPTAIVVIIFMGLTISGISKLIQSLSFYSEGYFKDKCLFDALSELSYFENLHEPKNK